ncbi:MAG: hypothetical protein JRJ58_14270 [Deltaproteobacteria bacterium]|nr:hypothetical protein [Deltaproteobacteria bacterium]
MIAIGALVVAGCSQKIHVLGVRDPGVGRIEATTTLYVELDQASEDADRDLALAAKIERVLTDKGFAIVPESEAVAHLFFDYEMRDLVQRMYLQPISGSTSGMKTVPSEGPFVHRLSVSVVSAETHPTTEPASADVLWVGGAVLNATSLRSPEVVDILIVALFDHFPEDTGRTVRVTIHLGDSRAETLRSDSD